MDIEYFFYVDDSTLQHLRPATSDERKWYHSLAQELGPYQKNIDRFQRVEDRFSALAEILEAPEKNAAKLERNAKDAVANFLYSFNECENATNKSNKGQFPCCSYFFAERRR